MLQDGDGDETDSVCCKVRTLVAAGCSNATPISSSCPTIWGRRSPTCGCIAAPSWSWGAKRRRTVVFEADGDHADQKGIEFRVISPEAGKSGLSATNHSSRAKHDEREAEIAKKRKEEKHYDLPGWLEFSIKRLDALNEAAKAKETDTVERHVRGAQEGRVAGARQYRYDLAPT